jgi:hypothetical protein
MGDEDKLTIEEYANITVADNDYWNDMITVTGGDTSVNYDDWIQQYADLELDYSNTNSLGANDIKLTAAGDEMLRVAQDGFYVRGVRVEADAKEAEAVYKAFKSWMTYAILNGEINN